MLTIFLTTEVEICVDSAIAVVSSRTKSLFDDAEPLFSADGTCEVEGPDRFLTVECPAEKSEAQTEFINIATNF